MDIFPGTFYEPSEEETKLEELNKDLIEKNLKIDFSKVPYITDES